MTFGIQVTNSSSTYELDKSIVFQVIARGTARARNYTPDNTAGDTVYFPAQSEAPLIFVRPTVIGKYINTNFIKTNSFELREGKSDGTYNPPYFDYIVMSRIPSSDSGYGLETYLPNGSLAFASSKDYMNLDGHINLNTTGFPASATFPTPPFGLRYILVNPLAVITKRLRPTSNQGGALFSIVERTGDNSYTFESLMYQNYYPPGNGDYVGDNGVILTGYI